MEFSIEVEPEEIPVRGYFAATEDPEQDRKDEDEIITRLDAGDIWAWCFVRVVARWKSYEGSDTLGGCSYASEHLT